ncbi:MAG: hypothetical protein BV459_00550 [Thermoplasmata archaeon M11B2D]|nr:MAG: hypothetical protein BV459_00550 [Thermoplasmata archaeon M11B2D]
MKTFNQFNTELSDTVFRQQLAEIHVPENPEQLLDEAMLADALEALKKLFDMFIQKRDRKLLVKIKSAISILSVQGAAKVARQLPAPKYKQLVRALERMADDVRKDDTLKNFATLVGADVSVKTAPTFKYRHFGQDTRNL